MIFRSQQLCSLNEFLPTMGCRVQQQQLQQMDTRTASKVKCQRPGSGQHKHLTKVGVGSGSSAATKVGVDDPTTHITPMTSQEIKIPVYANVSGGGGGGGHRSQKGHLISKSPGSRASPGTTAMAAYAGAKFSAAPPSPHALPKPPVSWVNPVIPSSNVPAVPANGIGLQCSDSPSMTSSMYGNLISNQLKLLLNVHA